VVAVRLRILLPVCQPQQIFFIYFGIVVDYSEREWLSGKTGGRVCRSGRIRKGTAMAEDGTRENVIGERLNHLFATVHPANRGPYTLREVADSINAEAGASMISAAYLSQLRTGQRAEPSHSRLVAIARFFGVDVEYFSDAATAQDANRQLEFLAAMRDAGIRSLAMRAQGLSEASLAAVRAVIENARRLEGLPDGHDGDTAPGGHQAIPLRQDRYIRIPAVQLQTVTYRLLE
jgi:transcriptional regulator with XRE-family HTH domain